MMNLVPLFPGIPGGPELLIILLIVVLLFGANKLPQLARSSGQALGEFKRGREDIERELTEAKTAAKDAPREGPTAEETEAAPAQAQ
ncbi:MAG: twin-arginine translocase TatA/TatE family subunit [Halobacteriota archaeon]